MRPFFCAFLTAILLAATSPANAADAVDTALVLAFDVSLSVNDARYALQKEGTAAAFESDAVIQAISSGRRGAIEVMVLEFSDPDRQIVTVPWTRLTSDADARAFAARIRTVKRSSQGLTGLANALLAAGAYLKSPPWATERRVVDLSSDGMSNIGVQVDTVRDLLVGQGITINGLPIISEEPYLGQYYDLYVIGGPDAFTEIANSPENFGEAIQRKLARELLMSSAAARAEKG